MLTKQEVEKLIQKLRDKYDQYAAKYNARWFCRDDFEDRLQIALRNKMNLEAFIVAEIANFEKIKERYEQKKQESTFSKKVDEYIEELTAKIKKYPKIEFNPKAHFEMMHMYGASNTLLEVYFPILWIILEDKTQVYSFEQQLLYLAGNLANRYCTRINDHILLLQRPCIKSIELEKDKNEYLKECAFLLHEINEWLLVTLSYVSNDTPLNFSKLYVNDTRKKQIIALFRNDTYRSALQKIQNYVAQIIEDFRLQSFKKTKSS